MRRGEAGMRTNNDVGEPEGHGGRDQCFDVVGLRDIANDQETFPHSVPGPLPF